MSVRQPKARCRSATNYWLPRHLQSILDLQLFVDQYAEGGEPFSLCVTEQCLIINWIRDVDLAKYDLIDHKTKILMH